MNDEDLKFHPADWLEVVCVSWLVVACIGIAYAIEQSLMWFMS
jgi:hypothetical protein